MASKSYWSYGKVNHKDGAMIPEGRILIDTAKSFVYTECGLKGVLMASHLSGLSPNLTSRFTPGMLISLMRSARLLGEAWLCPSGKGAKEDKNKLDLD